MVEIEGYNLPDDLYYTDRNLWVKMEADGTAKIGFNDLAQKLIGKIMFVRLPKEGTVLEQGKDFGTVESMKWVERLKAPLSGTVIEVNKDLRMKPKIIHDDPYGAGWFLRIKPSNTAELNNLIHGDAIRPFLQKEIEERVKKAKKT